MAGQYLQYIGRHVLNWAIENRLTALLVTVNAGLFSWFLSWKLSRRKRLIDAIPGVKDYPFFGDILHLESDPCGKNTWYYVEKYTRGVTPMLAI